jgi:hypothetical protein
VLLEIDNMRGVNLNVFDFDYDLTWAALFLNSDQRVLGRFGDRLPTTWTVTKPSTACVAGSGPLAHKQARPPARSPRGR